MRSKNGGGRLSAMGLAKSTRGARNLTALQGDLLHEAFDLRLDVLGAQLEPSMFLAVPYVLLV